MEERERALKMIQIMSVSLDAPRDDQLHQSTFVTDPRLLKMGKAIRRLPIRFVSFQNIQAEHLAQLPDRG